MVTVHRGVVTGLGALAVLLAALDASLSLGTFGWLVGSTCGVAGGAAVLAGAARSGREQLSMADLVTVVRASLACAVAALVAQSFVSGPQGAPLVVLATVALVLDAVDGRVARRTGTTSSFGAKFDGEADAFLILVLSVYAARWVAVWALAIGLMRYAFAAAGWLAPWLRGHLPRRHWRRVVAALQGIALTVVAAGVTPDPVAYLILGMALAMLCESFARDVVWLSRHRSQDGLAFAQHPPLTKLPLR